MVQSRLDIVQRCCSGDPYHNLANAIIVMAADDYIRAIKSKDILRQREIESFFYSDWYQVLTNVDPFELVESLKETCKRRKAVC